MLREGLLLIIGGFVLGAVGALALRKSLESQLFGVSATDPLVLAAVTGLLAAVAVVACALPARRATTNRSHRRARGVAPGGPTARVQKNFQRVGRSARRKPRI